MPDKSREKFKGKTVKKRNRIKGTHRNQGITMTKHIFVTGGVVSSLGKGLTSASIGMLLESRGLSVRMQKLDPYINVYPGILSPFQHGEVYLLDDGTEADLDLGHYERFTRSPLTRNSTWTTGQVYQKVLEKERLGGYFGKTIQVIPHITNEIKENVSRLRGPDVDVVITEIGGTVGDIEGLPYLEAIRQFSLDVGRENCLYVHLTLVPFLKAARELKTKPTQHSVGNLRQIGIQPDILICRTEHHIPKDECEKIALFCNVPAECVIEELDADLSVYEVPINLKEKRLDEIIIKRLGFDKSSQSDLSNWEEILRRLRHPEHEITVAVIGNYAEHKDAYKSVYESLVHGGISNKASVRVLRIPSDQVEREETQQQLKKVDGIIVPGGYGEKGTDGKIIAAKIARENNIPFFGICVGLHCALVEYGRNVLNLNDANSTEYDKDTANPVVCLNSEQSGGVEGSAKKRCGSQPVTLLAGTKAAEIYGTTGIAERHHHPYEFNQQYRNQFIESGLTIAGSSPDGKIAEVIELNSHPWFIAVQYHPEYKSQPTHAHPLFNSFVAAAVANRAKN